MGAQKPTSSDAKRIEQELRDTVAMLIAGCEALDVDLAFGLFWDSPEFRMIGMDGSLCDYATYVRDNVDYRSTCTSFELTTIDDEIRFLGPGLAIYSWIYRAEATLQTGERDVFENAAATFVFEKLGGEWKAVYYQESALPPKRTAGEQLARAEQRMGPQAEACPTYRRASR
jgi:hypothetical protein